MLIAILNFSYSIQKLLAPHRQGLAERCQRKVALLDEGVRHRQSLGADALVAIEQYVKVDGARGVSLARLPLLCRLGLAVAPQLTLHRLQGVEQLEGRK